ncbi:XPG N-terminal domain [Nakaseomyces glabratus]
MGIQGLLPQLKPIQNPVSLRRYEGQTLGIDGYAWLHRASCSCAYELAMGLPTEKYLKFFIKRFNMLKSFGVTPYLVFDGDSINVKQETNKKRREKRQENREIAMRLWQSGNKRNAMDYFQKCVDVTPEMVKCVIDYCKNNGIKYIVAPFEADPQMVYLEKKGLIQGIIAEDSDLLVFGCRRLVTKLNDFGECIEICRDSFGQLTSKFPIGQLSNEEIRMMVCLSGCDYTNGIPRIGLIKAIKLVMTHRNMDRILMSLQTEGKFSVPENFYDEYRYADYSFQFQRVFCPLSKQIVSLSEIPMGLQSDKILHSCIGKAICRLDGTKRYCLNDEIDHEIHGYLARGDLNPYDFTKRLVNREHKLQLQSKSDMSITYDPSNEQKSRKVLSIDTFFSSVPEIKGQGTSSNKQPVYEDFVEKKYTQLISNRKLGRKSDCNNKVTSKFFTSNQESNSRTAGLNGCNLNSIEQATEKIIISDNESETDLPESELPTQVEAQNTPTEFSLSIASSQSKSTSDGFNSFEVTSQRDEIGNTSEEHEDISELIDLSDNNDVDNSTNLVSGLRNIKTENSIPSLKLENVRRANPHKFDLSISSYEIKKPKTEILKPSRVLKPRNVNQKPSSGIIPNIIGDKHSRDRLKRDVGKQRVLASKAKALQTETSTRKTGNKLLQQYVYNPSK